MRVPFRTLLALATAGAALAVGTFATPASANPYCFGSDRYYYVCVVIPPVDPGSPLPVEEVEVYCGGSLCRSTDRDA